MSPCEREFFALYQYAFRDVPFVMRRLDAQMPWGREPEAGEDVVNDRRQRIERDNLLRRLESMKPQIKIRPRTPLPHLLPENNYKKMQMQADFDAQVRREDEKKAQNIQLRQARADKERRARPQGKLLRPTLTSFMLNKQRFEHKVARENRKMRKALREAKGTLPTKEWAVDAAKADKYRLNCSRYAKRHRQATQSPPQRSGRGVGGSRRRHEHGQQHEVRLPPISPMQYG